MATYRRTLLAAAGALGSSSAGHAAPSAPTAAAGRPDLDELVRRSEAGNAALMRGDTARWLELIPLAPAFVLMSPLGGMTQTTAGYSAEELAAIGRGFRNGTLQQEVVQHHTSADLAVLVVIERTRHLEVSDLLPQDYTLRVTPVYRRGASGWELVHRHADPLAGRITLQQSAALAAADLVRRS